ESEPMFAAVLATRRRTLGEEHPGTLKSIKNLAVLYRNEGNYAQSESLFTDVIRLQRRVLGAQHPDTLDAMYELARMYYSQGRYEQAESLLLSVLDARHNHGLENPDTARTLILLGKVRMSQRNFTGAAAFFRQALAIGPNNTGISWERF